MTVRTPTTSGVRNSEDIEQVEQDHYFTGIYSEDKSVYRYHPVQGILLSMAAIIAADDLVVIKEPADSGGIENRRCCSTFHEW
jgi:hypothetical protein